MGSSWGIFGSHLAFEVVGGDTNMGVSSSCSLFFGLCRQPEPGLVFPTTTNIPKEADH